MLRGALAARGVHRTHELSVFAEFFKHARVLATHWAVRHCGAGSLSHSSRGSDGHGAIDDRQRGLEAFDVTGGLSDKVPYLEWEADMQNINPPNRLRRRRDVYSDHVIVPR